MGSVLEFLKGFRVSKEFSKGFVKSFQRVSESFQRVSSELPKGL